MNVKASIAASVIALFAGVGCSSSPEPAKPAGAVSETSTTTGLAFASCAAAKTAGYHDMKRGEPGYSARLDGDGDGIACDEKGAQGSADPYAVYLKNNPEPGHVISREDAQTRALLGCGQQCAPGTVDAVLRDAYGHLCKN